MLSSIVGKGKRNHLLTNRRHEAVEYLAHFGLLPLFSQVLTGDSGIALKQLISEIYAHLEKQQRNEYYRLKNQLYEYSKAFGNVSVVASIHEREKVKNVLSTFGAMGDAVGIYVLSERDTIFSKERSREPREYDDLLDHASIFKLLRKRE